LIAALALVALAVGLGTAAPRHLGGASWATRAPGLGIVAWLGLIIAIFTSLLLAGLALAVPRIPTSEGGIGFWHACTDALRSTYATPGGALVSALGGISSLALLGRLLATLVRDGRRLRRERREHRDLIQLVCCHHVQPDVAILAHPVPAVYCLPGRPGQVVVTEGALAALTDEQLDDVLAHERAHLRGRHHTILLIADAIAATLWKGLGTSRARHHLGTLTEMWADDAVGSGRRRSLAAALLALTGAQHPTAALGAGGTSTLERARRLAVAAAPLPRRQRAVIMGATMVALILPIAVATAPAVAAILENYCPGLPS